MEKGKLPSNQTPFLETSFKRKFSDFLKMLLTDWTYRDVAKFCDESVLSKNSVEAAIKIFRNHHYVKLIWDNIKLSDMFKFDRIPLDDILREVTKPIIAKNSLSEGCNGMHL